MKINFDWHNFMSKNKEKEKEDVKEFGQLTLENTKRNSKIQVLSIIGEIEGHDVLSNNSKTTKYEHVLPKLAEFEDDESKDSNTITNNVVENTVVENTVKQ